MICNHLHHAVLGHEPITRGEIHTGFPFFLAHLLANRFRDLDGWGVHLILFGLWTAWYVFYGNANASGLLRQAASQ
jgi:hypothetical protein